MIRPYPRATASFALPLLIATIAGCRAAEPEVVTLPPAPEPMPPNIVLVMTDDQGYGDFGFQSNPVLQTPRLDAFRGECPTVERFYVSPVCSPTRASLMTGRYNYRTRVVDTWVGRSMMDPDEQTLAEILGAAGYRTGIFGKWHLGDAYPLRAIDQGFDEALVHRGGGLAQSSDPLANEGRYTDPILFRNGVQTETSGYCTDVYFDEALRFIDDAVAAETPFLAVVTTNAPHGPLDDVPDDLYAYYKDANYVDIARGDGVDPDQIARIYAMIENVDTAFGRLLDHLDKAELAQDTVVVFLSDNGPVWGRHVAGLRDFKTTVYEGGIRSPLFVRWPKRLSSDVSVTSLAAHIDLLPTLAAAAGVELPTEREIDGRNLLPLLEGKGEPWPNRQLFLQSHRGATPEPEHNVAVVEERWKLVRASGFGLESAPDGSPFELFDLTEDPGETADIASEHPGVVARLRAAYADWFTDVSTTREDNFAPPRIVVGAKVAPVTTLTRQDWRPTEGGDWSSNGEWLLRSETERTLELRVVPLPRDLGSALPDRVSVRVDGTTYARTIETELTAWPITGVPIGAIQVPAGTLNLQLRMERGDEVLAPYQVIVSAERWE